MIALRVSCQENLLPGRTATEKWDFAARAGYSSIELRGQAGAALTARLPELRAAAAAGAVFRTVCIDMPFFVGAFDSADRARAVRELKDQLAVIAELGGLGVVTPAAFGLFSRNLPPYQPPRTPEDDDRELLDSLAQLDEYAAGLGVRVLLEPLNRYEDYLVNTLAHARRLIDRLPHGAVRLVADSFHMNIEEADVPRSLAAQADVLEHVQISDSNRAIPGHGHLDWTGLLDALDSVGYTGELAVECLEAPFEHKRLIAGVPTFLHRINQERA